MMDFGWKKKAAQLRMVILSAGHQLAKELPPAVSKTLEIFARVSKTGDGSGMQEEMDRLNREHPDGAKLLWEPIEVHGWKIQATLYLKEDQLQPQPCDQSLWWLVRAVRKNERAPSDKDIVFLDKILDHLGAEPTRNMIIGPRSTPDGERVRLFFGWWTWQNRWPLFDVQVNKDKKRDADKIRIVPLGSRETEGYTALSAADLSHDDKEEP
jgi:hypothetical protein